MKKKTSNKNFLKRRVRKITFDVRKRKRRVIPPKKHFIQVLVQSKRLAYNTITTKWTSKLQKLIF